MSGVDALELVYIWERVNPFPHTTILQQTTLNIFCHYVFKKPSAAEASESIYMRERVKVTKSVRYGVVRWNKQYMNNNNWPFEIFFTRRFSSLNGAEQMEIKILKCWNFCKYCNKVSNNMAQNYFGSKCWKTVCNMEFSTFKGYLDVNLAEPRFS